MKIFSLQRELWLPVPREALFPFFAEAQNLESITPGFLRFEIASPLPIHMRKGARIDYRLRLRGFPVQWQSEITAWEPPCRFIDEQRRGPYRLWIHEHRFEERDGGTFCVDDIRYSVWGGAVVNRLLVRRDLEKIFAFREQRLRELFPG